MKILCIFHEAGFGIDRASLVIYKTLKMHYDDVQLIHNKINRALPLYYLIEQHKPDVIVTQDFFSFILNATSFYKYHNPHVKTFVYSLADIGGVHGYEAGLFDHLLLPEGKQIHGRFEIPVISKIFYLPLEEQFRPIKKWKDRKQIVYAGRIEPEKFDIDILSVLSMHNITLDVYGKITDQEWFNACSLYNSFNYKGVASIFDMPSIFNNYKFHLLDSPTDCFSISSLEAVVSGCIPIFIHEQIHRFAWAKEFSIQLNSNKEFMECLKYGILNQDMSELSVEFSNLSRSKFNEQNFIEQFKGLLSLPPKDISSMKNIWH